MPELRISIHDQVWPQVVASLAEAYGPIPEGVRARDWAEQIAAQAFAEVVAGSTQPAPKTPPVRRFRPSQARS